MGKNLAITRLYYLDVNCIDKNYDFWYENVSSYRRDKVNRLRVYEDKVRSLSSEALLRYALLDNGYNYDNLTVEHSHMGKPDFVEDGIHYNLSHSGDYVLCGISPYPIGVDIERVRDINLKIIDRFYSSSEGEYLSRFSGEDKLNNFFMIWSCKESYIKYTGEGLSASLRNFTVDIENLTVTKEDILLDNRLFTFEKNGHMGSACYKGESIEIREVNLG
ncbi:MAG: 4'-phosphopantetheinyl transferase superfamily protein [Clostridium sp.]